MSSAKVYNDVNAALFDCVKETSFKRHGTVYDPPGANKGTATTTQPGKIVLSFDFDPTAMTLTYGLIEKPWWIPESAIWNGIGDTINECRGRAVAARSKA
jgi:hypothetical protein